MNKEDNLKDYFFSSKSIENPAKLIATKYE